MARPRGCSAAAGNVMARFAALAVGASWSAHPAAVAAPWWPVGGRGALTSGSVLAPCAFRLRSSRCPQILNPKTFVVPISCALSAPASARAADSLPPGASLEDAAYMRMCVALALEALGKTSPNPIVGCVIVKDGRIVGRGFHPKAGEPHAEVPTPMPCSFLSTLLFRVSTMDISPVMFFYFYFPSLAALWITAIFL